MSIQLNPHTLTAVSDGKAVKLTNLEFRLLDFLVRNADRICSRDEILDAVWGTRFHLDTGTIDVHLNAIRRKMQWQGKRPIQTFRGVGLCYHSGATAPCFSFNIQELVVSWLTLHEAELAGKGLVPQLRLDPFVSEVRECPDTFIRMLDAILAMLLPTAQPGYIKIATKLSVSHFSFIMDVNGTINELKIPLLIRES